MLLKHSPIFSFTSNKLRHHTNSYNSEWLAGNNCNSTAYYIPRDVCYENSFPERNVKYTLAYRKTWLLLKRQRNLLEVPSVLSTVFSRKSTSYVTENTLFQRSFVGMRKISQDSMTILVAEILTEQHTKYKV
jgi:cation transport regulator ChaC